MKKQDNTYKRIPWFSFENIADHVAEFNFDGENDKSVTDFIKWFDNRCKEAWNNRKES